MSNDIPFTAAQDKAGKAGNDTLQLDVCVTKNPVWLRRQGNHCEVSIASTSDWETLPAWCAGSAQRLGPLKMVPFAVPAAGHITLPSHKRNALLLLTAASRAG